LTWRKKRGVRSAYCSRMTSTAQPTTGDGTTPVDDFSTCHQGILSGLLAFAGLPPLQNAAVRAREIARHTLDLFDTAVMQHHAEEEQELFPAVLRSAEPGIKHEQVQSLVWRLTDEHRNIEALWRRVRREVQKVAAGQPSHVNAAAVEMLTGLYREHALMEEREFLPLAREILGRNDNHMAALGMSLHMRHVKIPVSYI
jgi:hypothetical protein